MEGRRLILAIVGCYLLGLGILTGMLIEKIRFDESRSVLLTEIDHDRQRLHERLIAIERETATGQKGPGNGS